MDLNWWISVCVELPDCRETLNDDGVGIDLESKIWLSALMLSNIRTSIRSQKVKTESKKKKLY